MTLNEMAWTTANTQYYFRPATVKGDIYLSGDNVALSPALYATLYVNEFKNVSLDRIRVVSVGATNEEAEDLGTKTGLLDWVARLTSLTASVKLHTMDYMLS